MKGIYKYLSIFLLITSTTFGQNLISQRDDLESGFRNPPNEAKARTWWHWISGNVSKSGITKDLEAMKQVGIQEAQLFNVHLGFPEGSVKYLSEEWLDLLKFSAEEAERLGLELAFHNGAGWSSSGGPWVTPVHAMQTVVYSEVIVEGNQWFKEQLPQPATKYGYYRDIAILAFPKPKANTKIDGLDYKMLSERIRNHLLPDTKTIPNASIVSKETVINLTDQASNNGFLEWKVPEGDWVVLRIGHTPIGTQNRPAPTSGKGLEVDKMSKTAVDAYWKGGIQPIIDKLGDLIGTTVNNCLIDSYEVETTNWTSGFEAEFGKLRGYDLMPYLPTLAGYYVDSGEITERFLWDFRRTIGDLIAENYYAHFSKLCHDNNMKFTVEPYWGPFDNMQVGATGDIVMCEFWSGGYPFFDSPKFVSSIAHLNGSSIVGAESFTGIGGWDEHPAQFKSIGDRAWAEGITRFIFHTYVHQPWDVAPGLGLGLFGTDFNRHNTWWPQSKAFNNYIARSQFLLQQGKNVADVLVFTGESSPNTAFLLPQIKELGYDYDLIGANKLKDLYVEDGLICTPVGGRYKVLVLPESHWIKPETLHKIRKLTHGGAKVLSTVKPVKSPSLTKYPKSDETVMELSSKMWGEGLVQNINISQYLREDDLPADFTVESPDNLDINFIHRKLEDTDIYFIANARKESRDIIGRFRVDGKQPELWNTEKGTIEALAVYKINEDGTTSVPLQLGMEESVFILFKEPLSKSAHLVQASVSYDTPAPEALPNLEIVRAEYGTFLPEGVVDITEQVTNAIEDGKLDFQMSTRFCDCDPAMGYKKELRMEYQLGAAIYRLNAEEREHINLDAGTKELRILKAVFGKFRTETNTIPKKYATQNITGKIKDLVDSGILNIQVTDQLIDNDHIEGDKPALRITFKSNGEEQTLNIPVGQTLNLSKDIVKPKLSLNDDQLRWISPYTGKIDYTTSLGKFKSAEIVAVPKPVQLAGNWEVSFPLKSGITEKQYDQLESWSESGDNSIRYFSGTATYSKEFNIIENMIGDHTSMELDLGSVAVIAEVFLNGKNAGILWKAPFRVNIDDYVQAGKNLLEVKVTNLWPNRLIGDERLNLDYERTGSKIAAVPEWLTDETMMRSSQRTTFASWKHYSKDDDLLPSGLLGPVKINILKIVNLKVE
ncbi:MAG: glycosyl hydrolase [Leeuwenhoekiella sp.]